MIAVTVNGEQKEVPEGLQVASLLDYLGLTGQPLLVERNKKALLRSEWPSEAVTGGDQLELIRIVAGG